MRLSIDHRTRYRFSEPQARVIQLLRMTPLDCAGQTVIDWRIDVDCDARLREGRDGYGNVTAMLYVDGPIDQLSIMVRGEVLTDGVGGWISNCAEPLPPAFFLRATPLCAAGPAVTALAAAFDRSPRGVAALGSAITQAMRILPDRTPKGRSADEVLGDGTGNARDATHILIAAARARGTPARFVSGHCLDGLTAGSHKSAHCWAELHFPGEGWLAFDPAMGRVAGESYVRVAVGLDASDSTPLSGTRRGGGIEELDVAVRVAEAAPGE